MKRSAMPLPSGARTKEGLDSAPRKAISFWKSRLMYWEPWSWRMARPAAARSRTPPKRARTPWRMGSRASKRVARREAWIPTSSLVQWSTATKTVTWPSRRVAVEVASVPHITSGASVRMVPVWWRGPRGPPPRCGASRPASRIRRSTRGLPARTSRARSRAHTFRCPSPENGDEAISSRIRSVNCASVNRVFGPRRRGGSAGADDFRRRSR